MIVHIRMMRKKLFSVEHEKYVNLLLPRNSGNINFEETALILSKIFGDRNVLLNPRWQCFNLVKDIDEDFVTYARVVNRESDKSK